MAIRFDNIEAINLLNNQGEQVIALTNDQGITVSGTISSGAITSTGQITGTELEGTSLDINGSADISGNITGVDNLYADKVYINSLQTLATSSNFLYIDPSGSFGSGIYINNAVRVDGGLLGSYNEDLQLRTGTTTRLTLSNSDGSATFAGDVFSDGLYVNSTSAVSGTQVAIVADGNQNLQRWGSSSDGTAQASYRFRIDQNFKFIGNSGSGDTLTLDSTNGSATFTGSISASNFSGSSSGTNTGDQDLSGLISSITVGTGLDGTTASGDATISLDLSELTDMTADITTTVDELILLDDGAERKKRFSEIFGSAAYSNTNAFATAGHNHAGTYALEYENMSTASGADHDMHIWRKNHASYSNNGSNSTYLAVHTNVPQDSYSMGGFTLVYQDEYNSSGEGGEIKIYGYWNPESNSGFIGFRYECSNPYHTPTIEVGRNSTSGKTSFFISGEGGNYAQLIAKDLWLGYNAASASSQWGDSWVIEELSAKDGYTNFNTLDRNDFSAITTNGSTPSLTGGVTAAEVRTLIGAGTGNGSSDLVIGTTATTAMAGNTAFASTAQGTTADAALPKAGGTLTGGLTGTTATFSGLVFTKIYKTISVSIANSYVRIAEIDDTGGQISSTVRVTLTAHGSSHVTTCNAIISVGHSQDILIQSDNLDYTTLTLKVESNSNGRWTLSAKSSSANSTAYKIDIQGLSNNISITPTPTTSQSGTTLEHTTNFGTNITGVTTNTPSSGGLKHQFGGKMFFTNVDSNTDSTTALVLDGNEVEKRTLGSNAFNSTAYITSQRAISSTPTDGATTTAISSDWAFDNVKTAVPANAVFTDTVNTFDGAYSSLTDIPDLGTAAAAATTDFATAAQGTTADAALPKAGGTMTGSLTIGDGSAATRLIIKRVDSTVADDIQFYNGTTRVGEIGTTDTTWLRINQNTSKNIYTPRYIRADNGFFVDGTAKGINGSGNFIGGTITGASDANVSNWDTAYGWGDHSAAGYGDATQDYVGEQIGAISIPSGNAIIDWTADQGSTNIHSGNYINTTYSAGTGLDLTSTTFSVEPDLRDGITHVGKDANNYIQFDSTNGRIDFYAGGVFVARMESDGDLHMKGDVIAYSDIFS